MSPFSIADLRVAVYRSSVYLPMRRFTAVAAAADFLQPNNEPPTAIEG
jgi:hypothetical protein